MSIKDNILNSVIQLFTNISDLDERTKGLIVIRKFEDAVRPTRSRKGESCGAYSQDLYGEIAVDEIEDLSSCNGTYIDDCGKSHAFAETLYRAKLDIDFVDCGALEFASDINCKLSVPQFRDRYVPEGIKIESIDPITDITALEGGAVNRERVTFSMYVRYKCVSTFELPALDLSYSKNECGEYTLPVEYII